jgi:hypothetical protein
MKNAYNFDSLAKAKEMCGAPQKWFWKIDDSKKYVVNSYFIKNTFFCEFGRVKEEEIEWLLMHELAHYLFASEEERGIDNFGMPRDDQDINPITRMTFAEALQNEEIIKQKFDFLADFLNEYGSERFRNFKP